MTLETALSAPRLGRHELVPIFCCNNSIAILHILIDSMGLQISVTSRDLEHPRPLPVIRLLVVRMSRKHNGMYYALMGTVDDRRGYGGQQTCTICDARGPYPSI